jgi:uncharacterized membrane protein
MSWLVPSIGYVLVVGALGVTSKLALDTLAWQQLLPWTLVAYAVAVGALVIIGEADFHWRSGTGWALASAALAVSALVLLYVALGLGEASKVVPVTAAYPAATVVLAAIFLGENITPARVGGMVLVVIGVIVLAMAR